jgi:hypothetical protein
MNRSGLHTLDGELNGTDGAGLRVKQYFANHPGSPSAVRQPKVLRQGKTFFVLLGRDVQHGVVGLGNTVENALRAFDLRYLDALLPLARRRVTARARSRGEK